MDCAFIPFWLSPDDIEINYLGYRFICNGDDRKEDYDAKHGI